MENATNHQGKLSLARILALRKPDAEEVFLRHYDHLFAYALRLEDSCPEQAEDLVQDVFVALSLGQINLDAARDAETYLCGVLRHLHISQVRRACRRKTIPLALLEYDSMALALDARVADVTSVHEELSQILRHACLKKNVSKAASVLILRYFYGFYPAEIALIMLATRRQVDHWLWLARQEIARQFSEQGCDADPRTGIGEVSGPYGPALSRQSDWLVALHAMILSYASGQCLSRGDLRRLYKPPSHSSLPTIVLSHLVSCPPCLDFVCRTLGLESTENRFPTDTIGSDGSGSKIRGAFVKPARLTGSRRSRLQHRVRDILEHKPKELRLIVNGFSLASHAVTSGRSRLDVSGRAGETISFIEVFSEQEVRLLLLAVEQPSNGDLEQTAVTRLNDDRIMRISVRFTDIVPVLELEYLDPHWESDPTAVCDGIDLDQAEPQSVGASGVREGSKSGGSTKRVGASRWKELFFGTRPTWGAFALIACIAIVALFVHLGDVPATVSASTMLRRSSLLEVSLASRKELALHRTFRIERRKLPARDLIAARRVEIWESRAKHETARRVYDAQNRLLAGEWSTPGGITIRYYESSASEREKTMPWPIGHDLLDNAWRHGPSPSDFNRLIADPVSLSLKELDDSFEIRYSRSMLTGGAGVLRASLALRHQDLGAIRETIVSLGPNGEEEEISLTEIAFEQKPLRLVSPTVFLPDSELNSGTAAPSGGFVVKPEIHRAGPLGAVTPKPTQMQLAASELAVRSALHRLGADLGEQVDVKSNDSRVEVRGVLVSPDRRRRVMDALLGIPYLIQNLKAVDGSARKIASAARPVHPQRVTAGEAPLYQALKQLIPRLEDREAFVTRALSAAQTAYDHAWALRRLAERYDTKELALLNRPDKQVLASMIRDHSEALRNSMRTLGSDLQPVLTASLPAPRVPGGVGIAWQEDALRTFYGVEQVWRLTLKLLTSSDFTTDSLSLQQSWLQTFSDSQQELTSLLRDNNTDATAVAEGHVK